MNQLKTLLVGIDFSDCSRSAREQAVRLAKWNHALFRLGGTSASAARDAGPAKSFG
jgi:hypothetical protein